MHVTMWCFISAPSHVALIVVPSRELSQQTHSVIQQLIVSCSKHVTSVDTSHEADPVVLRYLHFCADLRRFLRSLIFRRALSMHPDIVVGTPTQLLVQVRAGLLSTHLQWLIIDEADLLFTYGYEDETRALLSRFSSSYQAFIMSATFTEVIIDPGCKSIPRIDPGCRSISRIDPGCRSISRIDPGCRSISRIDPECRSLPCGSFRMSKCST